MKVAKSSFPYQCTREEVFTIRTVPGGEAWAVEVRIGSRSCVK